MANRFHHSQPDYSDSDADASGSEIDIAEVLYDGKNGAILSLKSTFGDKVAYTPQSLAAIPAFQPSNSISLHSLHLPSLLPPDTPTTATPPSSLVSPAGLMPATDVAHFREDDDPEADRQRMKTYIQRILHHAESTPHVKTTLEGLRIPEANNSSLSSVLYTVVEKDGIIPSENRLNIALESTLRHLATSRTLEHRRLTTSTSPSPAESESMEVTSRRPYSQQSSSYSRGPSTPENPRKRKRDALDHPRPAEIGRKHPRTSAPSSNTGLQLVHEGIQRVLRAFQSNVIDKQLIGSIQLQLHHVFLFAVTSENVASSPQKRKTLGEIGKLIQLLGVLSGVQISVGDATTTLNITTLDEGGHPSYNASGKPHNTLPLIFPCPLAGCIKTFTKLYSLRSHQQTHLSTRPYHCTKCRASFSRAHDLTRHMRSHTLQVYQCKTCKKSFSRRDAFRRHCQNPKRTNAKGDTGGNGEGNPCREAEYVIIDAPAGQKKTASFWERPKNAVGRASSSKGVNSNDEAGAPYHGSAEDDDVAMRGAEQGTSNGNTSSNSNGGGGGISPANAASLFGGGGEELETDEVPLREFEGALDEMTELHELLRSTVESLLVQPFPPVANGHSQGPTPQPGPSRASTSYSSSHPAPTTIAPPAYDGTNEVNSIMDPFVELFPGLDFNSVGLTMDQLLEVERLIQEASSAALAEAEHEAARMEVADSPSV